MMNYFNDSFASESFYDRMRNNYYDQQPEEDYLDDYYEREEDIDELDS